MIRKSFALVLLFVFVCMLPAFAAEDVALYLDSTKIQLTGNTEYAVRVTAKANVKNDLPFSIEYNGEVFPGVMPAGEKEAFVTIVTGQADSVSKTEIKILKGDGYRVSTSRGKAEVLLIPDPVLIPGQGGMTVAPAGESIRVSFTMENNKILTSPISLELRDVDGNLLDKKSFSRDYDMASFKFTIPKDWTGTNYVALWLGDRQVSDDYIVEIRKDISAVYSVKTDRRAVAVSVDCGSGNMTQTRKWLDLFDEYNAKATFFVTGKFADRNREVLQEILDRGHEIGNHSWNHVGMGGMKYDEVLNEILPTNQVIFEATNGYVPRLFRAPEGKWGFGLNTMLDSLDLTLVQWTYSSGDSDPTITDQRILRNVTGENVAPGAIYLFHNSTPCFDIMDEVLDFYVKNGYEIVSISELLPDGGFTIDEDGVVHADE